MIRLRYHKLLQVPFEAIDTARSRSINLPLGHRSVRPFLQNLPFLLLNVRGVHHPVANCRDKHKRRIRRCIRPIKDRKPKLIVPRQTQNAGIRIQRVLNKRSSRINPYDLPNYCYPAPDPLLGRGPYVQVRGPLQIPYTH